MCCAAAATAMAFAGLRSAAAMLATPPRAVNAAAPDDAQWRLADIDAALARRRHIRDTGGAPPAAPARAAESRSDGGHHQRPVARGDAAVRAGVRRAGVA